MKKLFLPLFLIISSIVFGQGTPAPTYQMFGSQTTLTDFKGIARGVKGIIVGRYADTATANLEFADFYKGALIITDNPLDVLWQRNEPANRWLQVGSGVSNITNIYEALTGCYDLLNPGVVSWSELLIFDVSPADYVINCSPYSSAQTQITLDAAHATLNRIDVIYVDTFGLVGKITGTPAADPAKPQVDPSSQLELTLITILAGATTPSGIAGNVIYDQNTGSPEWPGTATGVAVSFGNTTNPFHLTIAADVGTFTAGQSFRWVKTSGTESINDYGLLKFYIRLKSTFTNQTMLRLDWMNGTTSVSSTVNLATGQFGFTRTVTGSYQIITIPLSSWAFTSDNVNTLRVTLAGSNASGFYIDWVQLQSGITQSPVVFPNGFGVFQTPSGAAISTQPNDISNFIGAGNISITATGKTVTWNGTSTSSTITIINDSTVQVCTAQGSCQTIVFSDVDAQNVWVINDTTLLVCNVTNTLCDTVDIPNPVFFDRAFFTPNQASLGNTDHFFNGFDLYGHGGTFIMDDDGLAIKASSLITPIQAVNNHTDLTTVKTGVFMGREVAGNGAAGLGVQLRTAIDNSASNQVVASDLSTEWSVATAGSETATTKLWTVSAGTLASRFQIEGSTRIIANGIRLQEAKGSDVAAANDLTLGAGGNQFTITGNTTINAITTTNWQAGSEVSFIMTGTPLYKNGTTGGAGTATMLLAGRVDFQAAAGDYIAFEYDGTNWYETNRKLAATSTSLAFSNYITESAGTVKLGGAGVDAITTLTAAEKQILMTFNSLAGTSGLKLTSTSTVAASNFQKVLEIDLSGANATASQSTYAAYFKNTHTGTSSVNYGLYSIATGGATANYGVLGEITIGVGAGVQGISTSGTAVGGSASSGNGAVFTSTSGLGAQISSAGTYAIDIIRYGTTTNDVLAAIKSQRQTTGTAADGIGHSFDMYNEDASAVMNISNQLISKWTTAANATRVSQFIITGVDNAVTSDLFSILGAGQLQAHKYGIGTFTGTAAKWLAVTSTGVVIEEAAPSGVNIYNSDGTITGTRTVSTAGFNTTWTGSNATNAMFQITNSNSTSGAYGLGVSAAANVAAISASNSSTGGGVQGTGISGTGIVGTSTSGLGGGFATNPSSTNTVANIIEITRTSSGTAANGIGGRIQFTVENEASGTRLAAALDAVFTEVTDATRQSKFIINVVDVGVTTARLTVEGDGRLYGSGIHNNANSMTGTTNQYIASGTFTSAVTASTNTDLAVSVNEGQWIRTGNVVTYSFSFTADPATTLTTTSFEFSLPVASNIAQIYNLMGTAFCGAISGQGAAANGVVANDTGKVFWVATDVTNQTWAVSIQYVIL